jgi:hypothetical protein
MPAREPASDGSCGPAGTTSDASYKNAAVQVGVPLADRTTKRRELVVRWDAHSSSE